MGFGFGCSLTIFGVFLATLGAGFLRLVKSLSNFRNSSGGGGLRFGLGATRATFAGFFGLAIFATLGFGFGLGFGFTFGGGGTGSGASSGIAIGGGGDTVASAGGGGGDGVGTTGSGWANGLGTGFCGTCSGITISTAIVGLLSIWGGSKKIGSPK